jgi:heat shock protein HtpX
MGFLDEQARRAHKRRNVLHSVLLLAGLGAVLAVSAVLMWGWSGILWAGVSIVLLLIIAPRVPPEIVMRMYRAREVDPQRGGDVIALLAELSRRAELPRMPRLFVIPSVTLNAFAVGSREDAAVAVTEGLVRALNMRELAGVLAHEVSHIRNNDLWIMGLADIVSRFTQALSYTAVLLATLNIAAMATGLVVISWGAVLILYLAPLASSLLQLGLSRAREYDADLEGALLTGDPDGLISALNKLERYTGRFWEDIMLPVPGRRVPQPSVLRSHPTTEERVARLKALKPRPTRLAEEGVFPALFPAAGLTIAAPRYRWPGVWY